MTRKKANFTVPALFLILAILFTSFIFADSPYDNAFLQQLLQNETAKYEMMFGRSKKTEETKYKKLNVIIDNNFRSVNATLFCDDGDYSGTLQGESDRIECDGLHGYVGIYEGIISNTSGSTIQVLLNIVFSKENMFSILTIVPEGQEQMPTILFFGELTGNLSKISTAHAKKQLLYDSYANGISNSHDKTRSDYSTYSQGEQNISAGYFVVGKIRAYHSNYLANGHEDTVYMKITTTPSGPENYVSNTLGYSNAILIRADRMNMSMESLNSDLYFSEDDDYDPKTKTNNVTIPIPAFIPGLGFQIINTTFSSCSVSASPSKTISGCTNNNKATWTINGGSAGWTRGNTDNATSDNTGIGVKGYYHLGGNISSPQTRQIKYTGSIRFKYYLIYGEDDYVQMSFTSNTATKYSTYIAEP